ncbi:hypothetical protein LOY57_08490 [Pseudomonas moraviensis]|uniref:hypothetical protein n=1 Tax=Pseudomonas moraviensis TaxID=321662 RepID=UPI002160B654|nr:hypothetical protein [Pseudomonas moraviensis]UVL47824.1 hypothetical protein LOY57_08490 [Pseudomonas moraviensis]
MPYSLSLRTYRPSQGPCHRHKRFEFNRLWIHAKGSAPFLCGKCPDPIAPASLRRTASPITSIVRVDFTARQRLWIIRAFAAKLHRHGAAKLLAELTWTALPAPPRKDFTAYPSSLLATLSGGFFLPGILVSGFCHSDFVHAENDNGRPEGQPLPIQNAQAQFRR